MTETCCSVRTEAALSHLSHGNAAAVLKRRSPRETLQPPPRQQEQNAQTAQWWCIMGKSSGHSVWVYSPLLEAAASTWFTRWTRDTMNSMIYEKRKPNVFVCFNPLVWKMNLFLFSYIKNKKNIIYWNFAVLSLFYLQSCTSYSICLYQTFCVCLWMCWCESQIITTCNKWNNNNLLKYCFVFLSFSSDNLQHNGE